MGKRRQASPAPFEREANDIFFARLSRGFSFCARAFGGVRAFAAARRLEVREGKLGGRGAARQRARGYGLAGSENSY